MENRAHMSQIDFSKVGYVDALQNKYTATREEFVTLIAAGLVTEDTPVMVNGAFYPVGSLHAFDAEFAARRGKLPKVKDVASFYGFDVETFETWLRDNGALRDGFLNSLVDGPLSTLVARFGLTQPQTAQQAAAQLRAEQKKLDQIEQVIVTTGQNLERYRIVRYLNIVSSDGMAWIDRARSIFITKELRADLIHELDNARQKVLMDIKKQALENGANAIIGVDFKTVALSLPATGGNIGGPGIPNMKELFDSSSKGIRGHSKSYLYTVTATGTAVEAQKLP